MLVGEYQPLGVTDIARRVSISKSTAYGILKCFQAEGLVSKDSSTKKYTVGRELMRLSKMIYKGQDLIFVARPYLEKLADLVDETVFLGIREYESVKIIDVIEAKKELKISSPVGTKLQLTAGAVGKIFLSAMSDEEAIAYLAEKGLPQYTDHSITDTQGFIEEIDKIRKLGYSLDSEEYLKGVRTIAVPIRQDEGLAAAIWLVGFSNSMIDEKLGHIIQSLKQAADQISVSLSTRSALLKN